MLLMFKSDFARIMTGNQAERIVKHLTISFTIE